MWFVLWWTIVVAPFHGYAGGSTVSVTTGVLPTQFVSEESCQEVADSISAVGQFDLGEGIRTTTVAVCAAERESE